MTAEQHAETDGGLLQTLQDVQFLAQTVDAIWTRVEKARWRSDAEKEKFGAAVDQARAVYGKLAAEAK